MNFRQLIIRAMLVSLALAACAGVVGILAPGRDAVWQLVWTAAATGVACALILSATRFFEKPQMRNAGLLMMMVIVIEFLMSVGLIWGAQKMLGLRRSEEPWIFTMLFLIIAGACGAACLRLLAMPGMRIAGATGLCITAVALVLTVGGVWAEVLSSRRREDVMSIGGVLALAGVPIVLSLLGAGSDRRHWRWIGVIASAIACAMLVYAIWENIDTHKPLPLAIIVSIALVVAHANTSMLSPLTAGQRWLRWATIAAVAATAILIDLMIYESNGPDILSRLAAAAGICASCGTIAMAVLARANRKVERPAAQKGLIDLTLICPRCNKKQTLPMGDSECKSCGLRITIKVEEPRCPTCDYLLYGLTSDRCPECGTPIREANPVVA